jgi:hypothetical protein
VMTFYHGTDLESAGRLLTGRPLDAAVAAARKIDGPAGFFLGTELADCEFFALRRSLRGGGAVIAYNIPDGAVAQLVRAGAIRRPVPVSRQSPLFAGDELFVPATAFATFNALLAAGVIMVSAA